MESGANDDYSEMLVYSSDEEPARPQEHDFIVVEDDDAPQTSQSQHNSLDVSQRRPSEAATETAGVSNAPMSLARALSEAEEEARPKCAICLQAYQSKALLDRCFHAFCFSCIMAWSARAHTCPLCKAGFSSLIYNIKNERLFEQYYFTDKKKRQQRPPSPPRPKRPLLSGLERRKCVATCSC